MSVTLISQPADFAFSQDQLKVKFTCTGTMEQEPVPSLNSLKILTPLSDGEVIVFKYGLTEVILTAADIPDDSGYQVPTKTISHADFVPYLLGNYQLSNDFNIYSSEDTVIYFEANFKTLGFDFPASTGNVEIRNVNAGKVGIPKENYGVFFRLWCQAPGNLDFELRYEHVVPLLYGTNRVEVPIGDKLHDFITADLKANLPEYPTQGFLECNRSCRQYYFEYAETYDSKVRRIYKSNVLIVLHGGLSNVGQSLMDIRARLLGTFGQIKFLKQGESMNTTRPDQLQFLYFFNPGSTFNGLLKCRLRFTDGSREVVTVYNFLLYYRTKIGFRVGYQDIFNAEIFPGKTLLAYEVWITDSEENQISEKQTYLIDVRHLEYCRYFLFWSSWGTLDSRMFYGKGKVEFDLTQSEAQKSVVDPSNISKGSSVIYDVKIKSKFLLTTGYINNRQLLISNRDFFVSALKYRVSDGMMLPVKVTSKTISELDDKNNLFSQNFEYEYLFEDEAYTEGDIIEPGMTPFGIGSGISDVYLTTIEKKFLLTSTHQLITL